MTLASALQRPWVINLGISGALLTYFILRLALPTAILTGSIYYTSYILTKPSSGGLEAYFRSVKSPNQATVPVAACLVALAVISAASIAWQISEVWLGQHRREKQWWVRSIGVVVEVVAGAATVYTLVQAVHWRVVFWEEGREGLAGMAGGLLDLMGVACVHRVVVLVSFAGALYLGDGFRARPVQIQDGSVRGGPREVCGFGELGSLSHNQEGTCG